jgi:quercetin dioxygenase-like cupin family protein
VRPTSFATCELASGGGIDPHVHSFEEFFYVLRGRPCITINGGTWELGPDECGFVAVGTADVWSNDGAEGLRRRELAPA